MSPLPASEHRLSLEDPEGIDLLAKTLIEGGFTPEGLRKALGIEPHEGIPVSEIPAAMRLMPPGPLATYICLFIFGRTLETEYVARDFPRLTPARLESLGVVRLGPDGVTPRVRIQSFGGLLLASDHSYQSFADVPTNYVLEINPTTDHVAAITPRRRVETALDIGCGSGVQSLLASPHVGKIFATDISARALNFTAFNARLNGVSNLELLEGNLLEPVAGRTFDLIMCNPPFAISPDSTLQFRDSGWPLDTFAREIVRRVPAHLNEGGLAVMICDWALRAGREWTDHVSEWLEDSGCDAVIFRTHTQAAGAYAAAWNRVLALKHPKEYEAALDRWIDYYKKAGIDRMEGGRIFLRRRKAEENWAYSVDGSTGRKAGSGEQILRIFEAQDWFRSGEGDARLLPLVFRPADLRLEQTLSFRDGKMTPSRLAATQAGGFQLQADLDPVAWHLLARLDGVKSVSQIIDSVTGQGGLGAAEMTARLLPAVKSLYAGGFLVRS